MNFFEMQLRILAIDTIDATVLQQSLQQLGYQNVAVVSSLAHVILQTAQADLLIVHHSWGRLNVEYLQTADYRPLIWWGVRLANWQTLGIRDQLPEDTTLEDWQEHLVRLLETRYYFRQAQQKQNAIEELAVAVFDARVEVDSNGLVRSVAGVEQLLGYPEEWLLGQPWWVWAHAEDREAAERLIWQVLREDKRVGRVWHLFRYLHASGEERYIATIGNSTLDSNGAILGLRDVTARHRAEESMKSSEARFRAVFEGAQDAILIVDYNTEMIIDANPSILHMLDYQRYECIDEHLSMLYPAEYWPEYHKSFKEDYTISPIKSKERVLVSKKGEYIPAEISANLIHLENGRLAKLSIFRDVREKRNAEQKLNMLGAAVENAYESIMITDAELDFPGPHIIYVNKGFERLTGYISDEVVGKNPRILQGAESDREMLKKLRQEIEQGHAFHGETVNYRKDGTPYNVEWTISPIWDKKGKMSHYVSVQRDVTDRKIMEAKISASLNEKEVLIKEVHHRVKNNMQVISSLLNMQAARVDSIELREILAESQQRIRSMALVHEQLYKSKDLASVDLGQYLGTLAQSLLRSYSLKGIRFVSDLATIKTTLDISIPCGLIVNELLTNSLKYAFIEVDEKSEIGLRLASYQDEIYIEIWDNGVGFPQNMNWKQTASLGLRLVHLLSDQLHAKVDYISDPGTYFRLSFKPKISS